VKRLCVFCGSSLGARPDYLAAASALGRALGEARMGLVYGGASVGLMGALADAALDAGAEVVGVIPQRMIDREIGHRDLTRLVVVQSMHERKSHMAHLADAFVALPGGFGTLDELAEVFTWRQLGLHQKPIGLLDVAGYFAPLLSYVDHAVAEGFVKREHRALLHVASDPASLLSLLWA
jgi:uncharacterized protein (TIGR00730 family)